MLSNLNAGASVYETTNSFALCSADRSQHPVGALNSQIMVKLSKVAA